MSTISSARPGPVTSAPRASTLALLCRRWLWQRSNPAQRAADAGTLLAGDGDAGTTDDDAFFAHRPMPRHGPPPCHRWVTTGSGRITAEVPVFQSAPPQVSQNLHFLSSYPPWSQPMAIIFTPALYSGDDGVGTQAELLQQFPMRGPGVAEHVPDAHAAHGDGALFAQHGGHGLAQTAQDAVLLAGDDGTAPL